MRLHHTILLIMLIAVTWHTARIGWSETPTLLITPSPIGDLVEVVYQRTVDGDTIKVSNTERSAIYSVRLFGVDCEEPKLGTAEAFASALFTATALENAVVVYLEYDDAALTDHYGRVLAWVWYAPFPLEPDTLNLEPSPHLLNLELLHSHNARPYSRTQSTRYQ